MDSVTKVRITVGILLFAVWAGLVVAHMTPVEPLVETIKIALSGLAAHTLIMTQPKQLPGDTENETTTSA